MNEKTDRVLFGLYTLYNNADVYDSIACNN